MAGKDDNLLDKNLCKEIQSTEKTPLLLQINDESPSSSCAPASESQTPSPGSGSLRRLSSSAAVSVPSQSKSLRRIQSYGTTLPQSWSKNYGSSPYTDENKPNRRPFHIPRIPTAGSVLGSEVGDDLPEDTESDTEAVTLPRRSPPSSDPHSLLYARYRYYSRLRAPARADDHALVIPDHVVPIHFLIPYIPGSQVVGADGKQASLVTIISIWNTMMGTSLLTMPWAFGKAGFAGGLVIMLVMAFLCLFTAYRMLTVQRVAGLNGAMLEASSLCREVVGGVFGRLVEGGAVLFSVITLTGALIVYWVLMSNFLFNTGQVIHDSIYGYIPDDNSTLDVLCPDNDTISARTGNLTNYLQVTPISNITVTTFEKFWNLQYTCPIYLLAIFVPLLCIKNTRIFSYFNSMGAISVLAIFSFVIAKSVSWGINMELNDVEDPFYVPLVKGEFMALSGTLSLAFFIHNCVITIMKGNRHQENNIRDLTIAYLMVLFTYVPVGVLFYITFPLPKFCVADNFLNNFPPHTTILAIVRVFLFFQMITVFPLLCVFLRTQMLCYITGSSNLEDAPLSITVTINSLLLLSCILVAIFYPNVGFIIRWVGAFAGLVYVFLLPCGLYIKALYTKGTLTTSTIILHSIIMSIGVANFIAQFFL